MLSGTIIWAEIVPSSLWIYLKFKKKALEFLKAPDDKRILAWGKDYFEYLKDHIKTKLNE